MQTSFNILVAKNQIVSASILAIEAKRNNTLLLIPNDLELIPEFNSYADGVCILFNDGEVIEMYTHDSVFTNHMYKYIAHHVDIPTLPTISIYNGYEVVGIFDSIGELETYTKKLSI